MKIVLLALIVFMCAMLAYTATRAAGMMSVGALMQSHSGIPGPPPGTSFITTEAGGILTTEAGDRIITE